MFKENYVKYAVEDMIYYIREELWSSIDNNGGEAARLLRLMQFSDFAINSRTNELIKCRYMLDDLLDHSLSVRPIQQDADQIADSVTNLRDELVRRQNDPTVREILFKLNSCLYKQYPHK